MSLPLSKRGNRSDVIFLKANTEKLPFPAPVNTQTGAIQPLNSVMASLAGCIKIKCRPGTSMSCKCHLRQGLYLFINLYAPSGIQDIWD